LFYFFRYFVAAHVGESDVEYDRVWRKRAILIECLLAGLRNMRNVSAAPEQSGKPFCRRHVVVDNKYGARRLRRLQAAQTVYKLRAAAAGPAAAPVLSGTRSVKVLP